MGTVLQSGGSVTGALVTTLVALVAFAGLGFLVVRLASGRFAGPRRRGQPRQLEVVERLPLDFKSSLYVVRGMGRTWLIGCGDGGGPRLLAELEPEPSGAQATDAGTTQAGGAADG